MLMYQRNNSNMKLAASVAAAIPGIFLLLLVYVSAFTLPMFVKKRISHTSTLLGQRSNHVDDTSSFKPYKLGLTPYLSKVPESEMTQHHSIETFEQPDNNQTMESTPTKQEQKLSYPHLLLQHPDRVSTATTHIVNMQSKSPTSLFIDEWMLQLPSKWAAFVSYGEYKNNGNSSNLSVSSALKEKTVRPGAGLPIVDVSNPDIDDDYGIGTFESSGDLDALWDASLNEMSQQKQSQYVFDNTSTKSYNSSKITRSSTQPQSIFANNFVDQWKNTTSSKASLSITSNQHPLLAGKDPNAMITVADLEAILRYNNFYSGSSVSSKHQVEQQSADLKSKLSSSSSSSSSTQKSNKGTVAFPQPTAISKESVKWGSTVSGGMMGMLLAISGAPNLWLVGILFGCIYGYETGQQVSTYDSTSASFNVLQSFIVYLGRRLARVTLKLYDTFQAFFFMYKTGQLSYEYYKSYAALDKRLSIQKKIDAWNARFVEGKLIFDRWERENEVGRKVLAGLRTFWLVGEQNEKKRSGLLKRSQRYQSRYRIIQFFYDVSYTGSKMCGSFWNSIIGGNINSGIRNFVRGLVRNDGGSRTVTQDYFRGVFLSVASLSLIGALFTISPALVAIVAAVIGWIWPTWVSEIIDRTGAFIDDTAARGRGQKSKMNTKGSRQKGVSRYDKNRYHYYRTADGKKRYYRVGEPWITSQFFKGNPPPKKARLLSWLFDSG